MQERVEDRAESGAKERIVVIEENVDIVLALEVALISTPIQNILKASQEVFTTPTTANTLLMLTNGPKFDKTTSGISSENDKSLVSHTEKLLSEEPTSSLARVFLNVNEI